MLAKKQTMSIVCLAMLTAALWASTCFADEGEGEAVNVRGAVSTTIDADDTVTTVQLATDTDLYDVDLDEKGLELAELDGQMVDVEGLVHEVDGQLWLKVLTFTVVEEEGME